jgi:predicted MPP superfamily phosphohydrolase
LWFVLLAIALTVVVVGGLYFRRRVLTSLELFGVGRRARRAVGWLIPWLLYGYPLLVFVVIATSLALGHDSFRRSPTGVGEWLLVYPFWLAVLVMLQSVPWLLAFDLTALLARRRLARDRLNRLRAIGCAAVIAVFAIYTPARILVERGDLVVNEYQVGSGDGAPLTIAFLADLQQDHHTDQARADQVVELINDHEPDLILAGGDWINSGPDYIAAAGRTAGTLHARLGTTSVRGDHEHFAYRDQERSVREVTAALADHGVDMLHNQIRWIEHDGKRIALLHLSYNYIYRTPRAEIRELIDRVQSADYSILITHQFDDRLAPLVENRIDLALIAHTHGGQVNPVVGFVHANIARVETPYVRGRYQLGDTTLIVTSGVGYSIAPFRYASPASIEIIELRP